MCRFPSVADPAVTPIASSHLPFHVCTLLSYGAYSSHLSIYRYCSVCPLVSISSLAPPTLHQDGIRLSPGTASRSHLNLSTFAHHGFHSDLYNSTEIKSSALQSSEFRLQHHHIIHSTEPTHNVRHHTYRPCTMHAHRCSMAALRKCSSFRIRSQALLSYSTTWTSHPHTETLSQLRRSQILCPERRFGCSWQRQPHVRRGHGTKGGTWRSV